ncbi:ubiquinol-cytochrome c reductase complex 6.7 kDa protein [Gossypium arboreum]|uniref:ubiquinol-cytochrome c reductase complex 6.7 kDa protein n=1 Tax=Gossypium arboreum TaxID=29729 RepID=UPI0022F15766|nr:ubiquinol-cytochrome c reductase complex 6.7 kDa protein [Gossypium arboreum]
MQFGTETIPRFSMCGFFSSFISPSSSSFINFSPPTCKFLKPRQHLQPVNVQAAISWGAVAAINALWLIQPFYWFKKTFLEKPKLK